MCYINKKREFLNPREVVDKAG